MQNPLISFLGLPPHPQFGFPRFPMLSDGCLCLPLCNLFSLSCVRFFPGPLVLSAPIWPQGHLQGPTMLHQLLTPFFSTLPSDSGSVDHPHSDGSRLNLVFCRSQRRQEAEDTEVTCLQCDSVTYSGVSQVQQLLWETGPTCKEEWGTHLNRQHFASAWKHRSVFQSR